MHALRAPSSPRRDPITPFDLVDDAGAYDADALALVDGLRAAAAAARPPIDARLGEVRARAFR